jgi:hypothetical protein
MHKTDDIAHLEIDTEAKQTPRRNKKSGRK